MGSHDRLGFSATLARKFTGKSWWRFAGTVCGVLAGVVLIQLHLIHPLLFIIGLASWLGICSGIGQLQRALSLMAHF